MLIIYSSDNLALIESDDKYFRKKMVMRPCVATAVTQNHVGGDDR